MNKKKRYLTFTQKDREQLMQLYTETYVFHPSVKHMASLDMLIREGFAMKIDRFYRLTKHGLSIAQINAEAGEHHEKEDHNND